jgi:hypothetical protein
MIMTDWPVKRMINYALKREFYIQIVDENSFIAVDEFFLGYWSIEEMAARIDCSLEELEPGSFYYVDECVRNKVETLFGLNLSRDGYEANLLSWSASDGLPYRTHSGREFVLMRDRRKPLSVFTSILPNPPGSLDLPKNLFSSLLESGKIVTKNYCEAMDKDSGFKGLEVVLYADAAEAWRIDAYILLRATAKKVGWSEPLIRMEGALLGYSDWQNDAFIAAAKSGDTIRI